MADVRYGGGSEEFERAQAALRRQVKQMEELAAREAAYQRELESTAGVEDDAAKRRAEQSRLRREQRDLTAREEQTAGQSVSKRKLDTTEIEKNTRARQRLAQAERDLQKTQATGTALIRHPTQYGAFPFRGQAEAFPPLAGGGRPGYQRAPIPYGAVTPVGERDVRAQTAAASQEAAMRRQAQSAQRAAAANAEANAALLGQSRASRTAAAELGTLDSSMHRHGALSAEFIIATARGETTLRELGTQAVVTAGKFGGWTLAATALFGAAAAIHRVGQGAIESSSGVHTLQRVINDVNSDKAQQAFGDLAREFNVPISVAVESVYRMGQVFHNQADAVQAARAALFSYKTGEVDVATSTQNLIAIVNGFHLTAQQLTPVYDQINQAQNTFGIRIADTEAGLAKAGGTYRNAGGDLDYLLGLFIAIQKATGRSGQEIGTGIARGVNQIRQAKNQAKLAEQGVEVDPKNFQLTIQRAMRRAAEGGADLQQIATGLLGNQYARLIAPVLADQRLLNRALHDTTPEKSKGSAQIELAKVLRQVDEQIQQIGVNLERMGEALGRSGALAPFGLMLRGLNEILNLTVRVIELFDKLPAPLRTSVALIAELSLALRAMRALGGVPGLGVLRGPDAELRTFALRGARQGRDYAYDARERQARAAYGARDQAVSAAQRLAQTPVRLDLTGAQHVQYQERRAALAGEAERAARVADAEEQKLIDAKVIAVQREQELAEIEAKRGLALRRYLAAQGINLQQEGSIPNLAGTAPLHQSRYRTQGFVNENLLQSVGQGRLTQAEAEAASTRRYTTRAYEFNQRVRQVTAERSRLVSALGGLFGTAGGRAITTVESSAARLRGAPGQLRQGLSGLIHSFGAIDAIFGAVILYETVLKPKLEAMQQESQRADAALTARARTAGDVARQARDIGGPNLLQRALSGPLETLDAHLFGRETPVETLNRQRQSREQITRARQRLQRAQATAQAEGRTATGLRADELQKLIDDLNGRTHKNTDDFARDAEQIQREIARGRDLTKGDVDRLNRALAQARRDPRHGDVQRALQGLKLDQLQQLMQQYAQAFQVVGARPGNFDAGVYVEAFRRVYAQLRGDPSKVTQLLQAEDSFVQGQVAYANQLLETGASYPEARRQIEQIGGTSDRLRDRARDRVRSLRDRIARERGALTGPGLRQFDANEKRQLQDNLQGDERRLQEAQKNARDTGQMYRFMSRRQRIELAKFRDAERDTNLALRQSRTADPVRQAQLAVQAASRETEEHARVFGRDSQQYAQSLTKLNQARQQEAQAIVAGIQAEGQLATARAGSNQLGAARAGLASANRVLAFMRGHRNQFSHAEVVQQQAEILQQQQTLDQAIRDRLVARFEMLESLTRDPVAQAHLQTRAARAAIRGTSGAERYRAVAEYNRARQSEADARLQDREDTIDFERQMERISTDTAIAKYQALLKLHNLTKQQRRDILLKIKGLRDEANQESAGFDLDVGSLKLPTIYDIRKAFDPIRKQMRTMRGAARDTLDTEIRSNVSHMYQSRADVRANISVIVNDPKAAGAVYRAIDDAMGTHLRAKMRSRGQRG